MQLKQLEEKSFIRNVLGKYASTAKIEKFDGCIILNLSEFTGDPSAPYLV
ncbi:hypothetical protein ABH892_001863 [Paenibacillus sp. RC254]|nr:MULTISPECIES: hypothetical protein [Paenibacillus]